MSGYSNRFTFACLPRTERGQPIVLGEDPKVSFHFKNAMFVTVQLIPSAAENLFFDKIYLMNQYLSSRNKLIF